MPEKARLTIPDLAGKKVLITGASIGIGAAVARAFGEQGAHVAVHYHTSAAPAAEVARDIEASGGKAVLVKGDVSDMATTAGIVEEAAAALGGLDGLINNAGHMLGRLPYVEVSDEHYDRVMDLNSRSMFVACRAAIPHLRKSADSFIISTTSIAARNGGGGGALIYAASKGFVSTLTRGLAKELIGSGIRVNAVSPGIIDTRFHEVYSTAAQMAAMLATIPQGRVGTSEDCVGAFLFLASASLSGYMIGQILEVSGGQILP